MNVAHLSKCCLSGAALTIVTGLIEWSTAEAVRFPPRSHFFQSLTSPAMLNSAMCFENAASLHNVQHNPNYFLLCTYAVSWKGSLQTRALQHNGPDGKCAHPRASQLWRVDRLYSNTLDPGAAASPWHRLQFPKDATSLSFHGLGFSTRAHAVVHCTQICLQS